MNAQHLLHNTAFQITAGALIGVTAVVGIYVGLHASAGVMGMRSTTAEPNRHLNVAEFSGNAATAMVVIPTLTPARHIDVVLYRAHRQWPA